MCLYGHIPCRALRVFWYSLPLNTGASICRNAAMSQRLLACSTQQNACEPFTSTSARLHTRHSRSAVSPHFVAGAQVGLVSVRFRKALHNPRTLQGARCRSTQSDSMPPGFCTSTHRSHTWDFHRAACARTCPRGMRVGVDFASRLSSGVDCDWCRAFAVIFKGAVVNFFASLRDSRSLKCRRKSTYPLVFP